MAVVRPAPDLLAFRITVRRWRFQTPDTELERAATRYQRLACHLHDHFRYVEGRTFVLP